MQTCTSRVFALFALAVLVAPARADDEALGLVSLPNGRVAAEVRGITRDCGYRIHEPTAVATSSSGYLVTSPDLIPPPCAGTVVYPYSVIAELGLAEPDRDVRWVQGAFDRTVRTPPVVETVTAWIGRNARGTWVASIGLPDIECGVGAVVRSVTRSGQDVVITYETGAFAEQVLCGLPPPIGLAVSLDLPPGSYVLRTVGLGFGADDIPLRAPFVITGAAPTAVPFGSTSLSILLAALMLLAGWRTYFSQSSIAAR